jgi:hypothetical protein
VFSKDEWILEDNGQQLASMKRNKKDDHDKDPDGMGSTRSSSVSEISASTFASSSYSKASQKDKQPSNDNNNKKKKGNIVLCNIISVLRLLICYSMVFALQEATTFKDGNITVHSFLDMALLYKCKGDFYNAVPITKIEDNNIKLLWITMIVLIIGLTMLFNSYIIPTELILRILHGIKTDIGGILSWIRKELKRDILLKTIKTMETKVAIEGKPLLQEDLKKLEETQKQVEEIDTDQGEKKDMVQSFCFCFEGFCRDKCLIFNCLALLLFSIVISNGFINCFISRIW